MSSAPALAVDLDGTLTRHDTMIDLSFEALRHLDLIFPFTALRGRTHFKHYLASHYTVDLSRLPWNENVVRIIEEARAEGRPVWLVTAANELFAERVAAHWGIFDGHKGSTLDVNLRGRAKADWLVAKFGLRGFDYMGDSSVDLDVWACSRVAYVASTFTDVARVRELCDDVRIFER